jgi:hypothetical protein
VDVVKKTFVESMSKSWMVTPGTSARTSIVPVDASGYAQTGAASPFAASAAVAS